MLNPNELSTDLIKKMQRELETLKTKFRPTMWMVKIKKTVAMCVKNIVRRFDYRKL